LDTDIETAGPEQWKQKYFEQMDALENREKEWRQTDELLRKTISRLTLVADGHDDALDHQLRDLREAIRENVSCVRLQAFIDTISDTLIKLDREQRPDAQRAAVRRVGLFQRLFSGASDDPPSVANEFAPSTASGASHAASGGDTVRSVLVRLLDRLALPAELGARVEALRDQIEHAVEDDSWDPVLGQIADLVQSIRAQTQSEKRGIESFLLQLSERLQEVDRQLCLNGHFYEDSFAAGKRLDSAVRQDIGDIESGVREAIDLDQVKCLVQSHVDSVLACMANHQEAEQQRIEQARMEVSVVTDRVRELESETAILRSQLHAERSQAQTDPLTGMPNRLAYEERLEQEIARWKRHATPLVLVIWDVDFFKRINDRFGHKAGDKALCTIARTLTDGLRETDFIARYGGEEFVHLLTGSELADCVPVAEKLRQRVAAAGFHFRGTAVTITVSCGLAQFRDGDSAESWFERADKALYRAKQAGRNRGEAAF
jgi:diguanylate cyclase